MAKITGPLMSLDARGNIGKGSMQFRGGLHGVHAYKPTPPNARKKTPTSAQAAHRAIYGQAVEAWRALPEAQKKSWASMATQSPEPLSGWNLYLREFINNQGVIPENAAAWGGTPLKWNNQYLVWE